MERRFKGSVQILSGYEDRVSKKIRSILDELHISYTQDNLWFLVFMVTEMKLRFTGIEMDSDMRHSNPCKYKINKSDLYPLDLEELLIYPYNMNDI